MSNAFLTIVLAEPGMRVLNKYVEGICSLKFVSALLNLQMLYVSAYGELNELRVGVEGDYPTVLMEGEVGDTAPPSTTGGHLSHERYGANTCFSFSLHTLL